MTHTHKWTNHAQLAYFTHNGHIDQDPREIKKNGWGKGNWGHPGCELQDLENSGEVRMAKPRRNSNAQLVTDAGLAQDIARTYSLEDEMNEIDEMEAMDEMHAMAAADTT